MDLLSSIRKTGSRGGVNFSWDEVSTSQHRENYLGHSLMAPVGRWQKGRDLSWYAKGDADPDADGESAEDKKARERKEEIMRIKEAEEDALARALGLPVAERNQTGANAVSVGEMKRVMMEVEEGDQETEDVGRGRGFGDFVGNVGEGEQARAEEPLEPEKGGLLTEGGEREKEGRRREDSRERRHRRHRHRSRSAERERHRHRSRSVERHRHRRRHDNRSRSPDRRERRHRSRSLDRRRSRREARAPARDDRDPRRDDRHPKRDDREPRRDDREPRRDADRRMRRSRSPGFRDNRGKRD